MIRFAFSVTLLHLMLAIVGLIVLIRYKKRLTIEKPGHNPLKLIYKVLKYAWKHKFPENRSAFTYWENDIPPRIDLGKDKYGGPFTTEEVEDTKSFFSHLPPSLLSTGVPSIRTWLYHSAETNDD